MKLFGNFFFLHCNFNRITIEDDIASKNGNEEETDAEKEKEIEKEKEPETEKETEKEKETETEQEKEQEPEKELENEAEKEKEIETEKDDESEKDSGDKEKANDTSSPSKEPTETAAEPMDTSEIKPAEGNKEADPDRPSSSGTVKRNFTK